MNTRQSAARKKSMSERALARRNEYWPEVRDEDLWHRSRNDGFATVPRTLPVILKIIDALTNGKPSGLTYFALWCRNYDESVIAIDSQELLAEESGFSGERKVTTWRARMKALQQLGFIDAKRGASGDFQHVLILNPHLVVRKLGKRVQEGVRHQLFERAQAIGATDMTNPPAPPVPAAAAAEAKPVPRKRVTAKATS